MEEVLICYLDEEGIKKVGNFKLISESITGLRVEGDKNEMIIPHSRLLKIKKKR